MMDSFGPSACSQYQIKMEESCKPGEMGKWCEGRLSSKDYDEFSNK